MPAGLKIKSNTKAWQKQAEQAANQINRGPLTRRISIQISKRMRKWTKQNFKLGNAGDWEPLSPKYKIRKGTKGAGILRLTDRLFKSVTERGGDSIADMRRRVGGYTYRFGTNVSYAEFHQFGDGPLPQRRILILNDARSIAIHKDIGNITVQRLARTPFFDAFKGFSYRITRTTPSTARRSR